MANFGRLSLIFATTLAIATAGAANAATTLFNDDFENRVQDQAVIGNSWTWYDLTWSGDTCEGAPSGTFGPPDGQPYDADNRNYWTASADFGQGDSYYRAGLEVPAWGGALSNMLRVYGNQYNTATGCQQVRIFQEWTITESGTLTFSFDVARDQYGAPANGEVVGAFVQVLKQSDLSYAQLINQSIVSDPPTTDATTAARQISFEVPDDMVGELLQFGFFNNVTPSLGQSWATSGAYYDNVVLALEDAAPPPGTGPDPSTFEGVPTLNTYGLLLLLLVMGATAAIVLVRRS
jgi:hypothetical protein